MVDKALLPAAILLCRVKRRGCFLHIGQKAGNVGGERSTVEELRFLSQGQGVGKKHGVGVAFHSIAAVRASYDAEFITSNDTGRELIYLKRLPASCALALHEFHRSPTA